MTAVVPVTLTDAEYRALATIAARNRTQVHVLIETQIRLSISPDALATAQPAPSASGAIPGTSAARREIRRKRQAEVRAAHARGLNDMQIAAELGCPRTTVCLDRRQLGLTAHSVERSRKAVSS